MGWEEVWEVGELEEAGVVGGGRRGEGEKVGEVGRWEEVGEVGVRR